MLRSSGSTSKPRGWGRPLESKVRPLSPARHMETVDSDGEAAPAPGYRQSFGDAIAAALQATSIHSGKPLLLIGFRVLRGYETLEITSFLWGHAKSPVKGLAVYEGNPVEYLQQALATILERCKQVREIPLPVKVFQYFI